MEKEAKERLKLRKQSLPPEPQEGEGIITFAFRLLNGEKVVRKFLKSNPIQLLFDYVETLDNLELEQDITTAKIDLILNFPKMSLLDKKEQTIGEVFPDGDQE